MLSWFDVHDNRITLAHWMLDNGRFTERGSIIDFFEKPWNYTEEWLESLAA